MRIESGREPYNFKEGTASCQESSAAVPAARSSPHSSAAFLHNRVEDAFLHSRQIRRAVQHHIGVALARLHILQRSLSDRTLVLPAYKFLRALALRNIANLPAAETDFVGR